MSVQDKARPGIDYAPCRYGTSRTLFRGPAKPIGGNCITILGGTETYGQFVERPYPDLIESALNRTTVNFGCINAGLDVFINDPVILRACAQSALTVVQILGAQNMSNRFYAVHPRRNDRFLRAARQMTEIWPEVDFTEIHFTRHLLSALRETSGDRFQMLQRELSEAWVARMRGLARELGQRLVLLWMSDRQPGQIEDISGTGPLFITREMIETLRPDVLDIVEVVAPAPYGEEETRGMVYPELERKVAEQLPGPRTHAIAAEALTRRLDALL